MTRREQGLDRPPGRSLDMQGRQSMLAFAVSGGAYPGQVKIKLDEQHAGSCCIAQTLGRAMTRLDNQSRQIERLDDAVRALNDKVDRISRDFAYTKKVWWIVPLLIGIALKEGYDTFVRPLLA